MNRWGYVVGNPINLSDPTGNEPIEWLLAQLAANTKKCYDNGDVDCVWRNYKILATGGYLKSEHASIHLNNFLTKGGDIEYTTALFGPRSSKWIMQSNKIADVFRKVRKELLLGIWKEAKLGNMSSGGSIVKSKTYPVDYDYDNNDVYYGLGQFYFWAEAEYSIGGCYTVEIRPTYKIKDTYDWHIGLAAGGPLAGVADFKDDWTQMLVNANKASTFKISGSWKGPNRKYTFLDNWLELPRTDANDFVSEEYLSWSDRIYDVFAK
jgi:hypothetical protein